jgi:hypothetical protein
VEIATGLTLDGGVYDFLLIWNISTNQPEGCEQVACLSHITFPFPMVDPQQTRGIEWLTRCRNPFRLSDGNACCLSLPHRTAQSLTVRPHDAGVSTSKPQKITSQKLKREQNRHAFVQNGMRSSGHTVVPLPRSG